ncbi:MAG: 23S rRNA (adenine(2503)-C(2))-methyltransferase RlmN [Saprospiraceae bacterium]|nr:23S rRNA (adenine(2503)-C(2))-methyltransferase RlmN [Bacteroidia bacterium]NNL91821.1 23S rRNA (adenine(2503)-C(2))-methyltransferase RlmN [Saprospiraceae bacterium]
MKLDIRNIDKSDLDQFIVDLGLPKFKSNQIWEWVWKKSKTDFSEMRNLPKDLIKTLDKNFVFHPVTVDKIQKSSDGTIKSRLKLYDDHLVESVLIPVVKDNRYTACVSSQVGCSLNCSFCATGKMKRMRNLGPAEIYDQVVLVNKQVKEHFGHHLTNIVFMGMGEPLLNYKNLLTGINYICSDAGLGMSPKRITVSTVGIAKMIKKLADDEVKFNLALSLHAATDEKRSQIMPINDQNDLSTLMEALNYFYEKTKNRISYEYISFKGFNDTLEDAANLYQLTKHFPVKINIIEYNPIDGVNFEKSLSVSIDNFAKYLKNKGVMVTVRRSRGKDIDAACGQLANKG